jgi:tRNA (guanosine-2'-O-)-methyltransferase
MNLTIEYQPSIELKEFLFRFITDEKIQRFNEVISKRTRHITIVMEDIYQGQNTNAVIRSCECFGVQDVHIIENKYDFEIVEDISKGSFKWVDIHQYKGAENNTVICFEKLKQNGYTIIGTSPHENDMDLQEISLDTKTAFVLGSEREGLSQATMDLCDGFMKIPMAGFTESLNLSNCSAIIIQNLTSRLWKSNLNWQLTEEEKTAILIEWCFEVVGRKELLLEYFKNKVYPNLNQTL